MVFFTTLSSVGSPDEYTQRTHRPFLLNFVVASIYLVYCDERPETDTSGRICRLVFNFVHHGRDGDPAAALDFETRGLVVPGPYRTYCCYDQYDWEVADTLPV